MYSRAQRWGCKQEDGKGKGMELAPAGGRTQLQTGFARLGTELSISFKNLILDLSRPLCWGGDSAAGKVIALGWVCLVHAGLL